MLKTMVLISFVLVSFIVGFGLSNYMWKKQNAKEILYVQATKEKNNLLDQIKILNQINSGCMESARDKLSNDIDIKLMYLAEYLNHFPHEKFASEISEREPELLEKIEAITVDWSKTYVVRKCSYDGS